MLASFFFFFCFNNHGIKIFTSWPNPQVITFNNTADDTFWTGTIRWCQLFFFFFFLQTIHPWGGALTSDQGQLSVLCSLSLWSLCAGSVAGPQRRSRVHRSTCTQEDGQQREGRSPAQGQEEGSRGWVQMESTQGDAEIDIVMGGKAGVTTLFLLSKTPRSRRRCQER